MSAERQSLGESSQHGRRNPRPRIATALLATPLKGPYDSLVLPLIPAGPASALAIPPFQRRRVVS